jgi:hypothetical protein
MRGSGYQCESGGSKVVYSYVRRVAKATKGVINAVRGDK